MDLLDLEANCQELSICRKRSHHRLILPMIDRLLKQAQIAQAELNNIICNIGPGSFVGLRISLGVAQGISYANSLQLSGVSSLEVLATQVLDSWLNSATRQTGNKIGVLSMCDSKPGEVYWAYYLYAGLDDGLDNSAGESQIVYSLNLQEVIPPSLSKLSELQIPSQYPLLIIGGERENIDAVISNLMSVGRTARSTSQILLSQQADQSSAKDLLKTAISKFLSGSLDSISPAKLTPLYLRDALS